MECSEAEMGEGARKPLQWHMAGRSWVWRGPHPTLPLPSQRQSGRGAVDANTALLKTSLRSGNIKKMKKKRENMRL